ncbi:hypothetical protein CLV40_101429 [Actinokineospora auranticolor]|uniref:CD-NTase-associated protein 16 NUDIX domain-containing protein n=1 Tax=Actinokineospora auranticolor TaxID=155976 RepID=A0A2S6H1E3_9PSEU|nr:hypothetical protein CLV40_101429 [Actinokineospora auranticolor]
MSWRSAQPPWAGARGRSWAVRDRAVRVSYAAFLRIPDDGCYVLVHNRSRPGAYGPPGGVFKFFEPGARVLDQLGFRPERPAARGAGTRSDVRGLLPRRSLRGFRAWFDSGTYREDAVECLNRELGEALAESGFAHVASDLGGSAFRPVRTVVEGPYAVPGVSWWQVRRFEIHELVATTAAAARLRHRVLELAADPAVPSVIGATTEDIIHGRCGPALVAPPTAYLIGDRRLHPDLPPLR